MAQKELARDILQEDVVIRTYRAGDAGYVDYLHMKLYQDVYQFKPVFESYIMKGLTDFLINPQRGMLWVAESAGEIVGCIAIVNAGKITAQLRWFLVEEQYQGCGIGKRLMEQALEFCRAEGYRRIYLWTPDFLESARRLYMKSGFHKLAAKPNDTWTGYVITEELWEMELE